MDAQSELQDQPAEIVRVLLVEDDPDDAFFLHDTLADIAAGQFELRHVTRLRDAREHLARERYDIVLSDLSLPDSQGLETFHGIHEIAPDVPVVMLTGLDDERLARAALNQGAQDYLVKGQVTGDSLLRSIRYAIERQRTSHYRALLVERERFDTAVSLMSDGIVVTDGEWRVTLTNRAARLLLHLPEEGWEGTLLHASLQPFALSASLDTLLTSTDRVTAFEITRVHTTPSLYIDARLTRLFANDGNLVSAVLMLRDVTEQRQSQFLRADFVTLVSHKLRTPLTILVGFLNLWKSLPPERMLDDFDTMMEIFHAQVARLDDAVRKLLDFKGLARRQMEVEARPADIASVTQAVAEEIRQRYPSKQMDLTVDIADGAECSETPAEDLSFIVEKFLDNAVKFGDKESIQIRLTAERQNASWLRICISDNGPGVPHEYYDRIFEGFVQVEDRVTGQVPGMGVGLYIARQVIAEYNGSVTVQSELGKGTTFTLTLPACSPGYK